jgi:hypothetical protein
MKKFSFFRWIPAFVALFAASMLAPALGLGTNRQTIHWTSPADATLALNTPAPISATASSGLPVTLRVMSGPASIANGEITVTQSGTVWVFADQAGDANYAPARATRSFNVRRVEFVRVGGLHNANHTAALHVVGRYAYVAAYEEGLGVIDVLNPANPVLVGAIDTPQLAQSVQVSGNYAYVSDGGDGLQVFNINNPASPSRVGGYSNNGYGHEVDIVGNYAYFADGVALQILNISNPANPIRVGGLSTGGQPHGVHVVGNYAYVADLHLGLVVMDIRNPATPVRVGGSGPRESRKVRVAGNHAYVADTQTRGDNL